MNYDIHTGILKMDLDLLKHHITQTYKIEPIIKIEKPRHGSGNTFHVDTKSEKYIAKLNELRDFISIYNINLDKRFGILQKLIMSTDRRNIL